MHETLSTVLNQIEAADAAHGAKLRKRLSGMDAAYIEKAERHFAGYRDAMQKAGKSLEFGIRCYLRLCEDMREERLKFIRTGRYSNTSYREVERTVYGRPEVMEYHMHGLALAQFLWLDQYERLAFFCERLPHFRERTHSYLEIGGGHGVYTQAALGILHSRARFDLVDISESSLQLARSLISARDVNFILADIFQWDTRQRYDFITIAEVIEHVENPGAMLNRVRELLAPGGAVYLTTPINAPMIDHIYLFNNVEEIRSLVSFCGLRITAEKWVVSDDVPEAKAIRNKLPIMYAAFLDCPPAS